MSPRRTTVEPSRGVFNVEWPLFGELSRGLALKVARAYQPEIVIGIATAGVVPGAVIAAILDVEFHSMIVSRRFRAESVRATPAVFGEAPSQVRERRVLLVDETCDSGATLRLAISAVVNAGATEVRTAVGFKTGDYAPDFHALATQSTVLLPWDREVLANGELVPESTLRRRAQATRLTDCSGGLFIGGAPGDLVIHMAESLSTAEQEPAAGCTHGSAFDFHDRDRRVGEAAKKVGKHSRGEMASRELHPRVGIGFRPIRAIQRTHGVMKRANGKGAPAEIAEEF